MFVWTTKQSIVCIKGFQDSRDIMIRVCEGNAMTDSYRYRNNLRRLKRLAHEKVLAADIAAVRCDTMNE